MIAGLPDHLIELFQQGDVCCLDIIRASCHFTLIRQYFQYCRYQYPYLEARQQVGF